MKIVTSTTIFNDAVGKRMSITYSEIDDETGRVISDNKRLDRVIVQPAIIAVADELKGYAQEFIDAL